jgi:phosphoenolpyruvate carboxykinase (ATP)
MHTLPVFNFQIPTELDQVSTGILDPRKTYADEQIWTDKATELGGLFVKNFKQYTDTPEGHQLIESGPQV